jgi:hypothetical protein
MLCKIIKVAWGHSSNPKPAGFANKLFCTMARNSELSKINDNI